MSISTSEMHVIMSPGTWKIGWSILYLTWWPSGLSSPSGPPGFFWERVRSLGQRTILFYINLSLSHPFIQASRGSTKTGTQFSCLLSHQNPSGYKSISFFTERKKKKNKNFLLPLTQQSFIWELNEKRLQVHVRYSGILRNIQTSPEP